MTPSESTKLIEAAGGEAKFAELLGIPLKDGFKQRINNWKRRGIPSRVELENQDVIQKLSRQKQNS